ncbi:hypothetical protein SAMN04487936_11559 [Halobacillus dabanensis]|uniref:Uncharacterized protein n=1 Tax=Halobacillus dabanensis TaxID=240302 RepID=A0A1I3ZZ41_HALDA|nr:hypothetical protein SAMN04487936_11559 [Halobacillus dabanensis]
MELHQFLKDEKYISAKFSFSNGKRVRLLLNEVSSDNELFEYLDIPPILVKYFPYERIILLGCEELNSPIRVKLY